MRKLGLGLATATAVIATPAVARDGAWYVGGDFGAMIVEDADIDVGAQENAIELDYDYGYDGALFVYGPVGLLGVAVGAWVGLGLGRWLSDTFLRWIVIAFLAFSGIYFIVRAW